MWIVTCVVSANKSAVNVPSGAVAPLGVIEIPLFVQDALSYWDEYETTFILPTKDSNEVSSKSPCCVNDISVSNPSVLLLTRIAAPV